MNEQTLIVPHHKLLDIWTDLPAHTLIGTVIFYAHGLQPKQEQDTQYVHACQLRGVIPYQELKLTYCPVIDALTRIETSLAITPFPPHTQAEIARKLQLLEELVGEQPGFASHTPPSQVYDTLPRIITSGGKPAIITHTNFPCGMLDARNAYAHGYRILEGQLTGEVESNVEITLARAGEDAHLTLSLDAKSKHRIEKQVHTWWNTLASKYDLKPS